MQDRAEAQHQAALRTDRASRVERYDVGNLQPDRRPARTKRADRVDAIAPDTARRAVVETRRSVSAPSTTGSPSWSAAIFRVLVDEDKLPGAEVSVGPSALLEQATVSSEASLPRNEPRAIPTTSHCQPEEPLGQERRSR
jgi:hypothetical protein